jgi:plastocyanin
VGVISRLGELTAGKEAGSFDNAILATVGALMGKASVAIDPGALKELSLTPSKSTVRVGDRVTFTASGKDAYGNAMKVAPVFTIVKGGGTIDGTGVFTAETRPGIFAETVKADASGVTALATVEITPGPLVLIGVEPSNPSLKPGETQQFAARPRDAFGNDLAGAVVWSADPRAGAVTAEGLFAAGETPGDFPGAVTASVETVEGKASVQILSTIDAKMLPGGSAPVVGCAAGGSSAIGLSSTVALWAMLLRRRRRPIHRDGRGAE